MCPGPTDCWSPWSARGTALPAARRWDTGSRRFNQHFYGGGETPKGLPQSCISRSPSPALSVPPGPLAGAAYFGHRPACLSAPPAQRQISRASGNHSYRSSTAALGGGQNPVSPAEPPAVPPAPSPAERTPVEAQLGAARSAAGAFRAAADSTSSSSPSLLALSLIPLLKHPPLPSPPVERSAGERGASARPPVLSPRRCPPRAPAPVAVQVRAARDVKETVMWPLSGGADPAGLEVSPAFLSFSLLA